MKKILLTCIVALSMIASEAQTKNTSKKYKKSHVNKEARANAEFARVQKEKQMAVEAERIERLTEDSIRKEDERLAEEKFQQDRTAWKENRLRQVDSTNQESWKTQIAQQGQWNDADKKRAEMIKAAKLKDNQGRQVKVINELYNDKAQVIRNNTMLTDAQRKEMYTALNNERVARIKAVIGKSKFRKLEKERKEFAKNNRIPLDEMWIEEANGYVKN